MEKPSIPHVGRFEDKGHYLKDFFVLKKDETFHIFYNIGKAGPKQDWSDPGNEEMFGHATSEDLRHWRQHAPILPVVPNTWENKTVSAPSILKIGDTFKMIYTGFDRSFCERIGLAESKDLFHWTRHAGGPVYEGPAWTDWKPGQWADCRDAHIIRQGNLYLMYVMVHRKNGQGGAIAIARSKDLVHWEDRGAAVLTQGDPESPTVFERDGWFYMFTSAADQGRYRSRDPEAVGWERIEVDLPNGYTGWEVFQDGDRWILGGFNWRMMGNEVRFWEITWKNALPVVHH